MYWTLPVLGAVLSALLMLMLAAKWRFLGRSAASAAAIAILVALPFFWIYPMCGTDLGLVLSFLGQVALALAIALGLLMWRFWRDPERVPPEGDGIVLSAADGKILYVRTIDDGSIPMVRKSGRDYLLRELMGSELLAGPAHVIAIEMSFLDVHVNRCPIAGQVKLRKSIEGGFLSLRKEESPFRNARLTTIVENSSLSVAVVQVASRLVRRVDSFLTPDERVGAGQRLGMIRLGSLVAVIIPQGEGVGIRVKPDERVTAGVSILAHYDVECDGGQL